MPQSNSSGAFYQKLSAYPLMTPERRAELLSRFYATQIEMIAVLADYLVPLYRYFARQLEERNTDMDGPEESEEDVGNSTRVSRLKGAQLKQIAKILMELKEVHERGEGESVEVYREQLREIMLGFDYTLLSTLASPFYTVPAQAFVLDISATQVAVERLKDLTARADEDRNSLFTGNWRLVMEIARRFQSFGSKLDLDELTQEGNTGLLAAIDKFNPTLNNQLSTLAANWIQAKIRRALDNNSETIRTPVYKRQRKKMVQKAELELLLEAQKQDPASQTIPQGASPLNEEMLTSAERLFGRTVQDKQIAERTGLGVEEVQELRRLYPETVSIHATVDGQDDGDGQERGDLLADKSQDDENAHNKSDRHLFFSILTRLVEDLPLVHQVVLSGLNGLPIRKDSLKKLVADRAQVMKSRADGFMKNSPRRNKASIQMFE